MKFRALKHSRFNYFIQRVLHNFGAILQAFWKIFVFSLANFSTKQNAMVFNVAKWKRSYVKQFLPEFNIIFLALDTDLQKRAFWLRFIFRKRIIVWGRSTSSHIYEYAEENNIPIYHIEDGFIRSIGLGANHIRPLSLSLDKKGLYYDAFAPSDLEDILNTYEFKKPLLDEAQECLELMRSLKISKYNEIDSSLAEKVYGPKISKRILILGQVEDDQSLLWGCEKILTNAQFLEYVLNENPDAQIIYKPHPDVMDGLRKEIENLDHLKPYIEVLDMPLSLYDALHEVDVVYTMTSLGGFEALIHGVPVVTYGAPFYSGWGITEDRQLVVRRTRERSLLEVFAAAYILYPRYRLSAWKKSSLKEILLEINEQLELKKQEVKEQKLEELSFINFSTTHPVNARFISNSAEDNLVIVTDSSDVLKVAKELMLFGKRVCLITTRDVDANSYKMLTNIKESEGIEVVSIHKKFSLAMSKTEQSAIDLSNIFGMCLEKVMEPIIGEVIDSNLRGELQLSLKDYIYFESLRFNALKDLVLSYDKCILAFEDPSFTTTLDIFRSVHYHATNLKKLGKIYLTSLIMRDSASYISSKKMYTKLSELLTSTRNSQDTPPIRENFLSWWWEMQDKKYNEFNELDSPIMVCGNITNLNYGYSPASLYLTKQIDSSTKKPLIFFNSGLVGSLGLNEIKTHMIDLDISHKCFAYRGSARNFTDKYPAETISKAQTFKSDITNLLIFELGKVLSEKLLEIFEPRIETFTNGMMLNIFFISEVMSIAPNATLFATSMDRNPFSRIIAHIAHSFNIPSIGIQPQIVSESPRYIAPAVKKMGAINTKQIQVYENLGAIKGSVYSVGSVNIYERLKQLNTAVREHKKNNSSQPIILLAMQHSSSTEMIEIVKSLAHICHKYKYSFVIKPHPCQETPVLNRVRALMAGKSYVKVMTKESDTYNAIATADVVVSLFSSVLMESGLFGKGTISAAFNDLHESVDLSKIGLALKALSSDELEEMCVDLITGGRYSEQLKATQNKFLDENPQFKPPYNLTILNRFISENLPKD